MLAACGGPEAAPKATPAPTVIEEPDDASVFQGQTALFQVRASGTGLTYQWTRDGTPVPGATDSHYVTPPTVSRDDGVAYQVVVASEGSTPALSRAARLAVHPPLDLRFQWVGAPIAPSYGPLVDLLGNETMTVHGVGGPLLVGEGICAPAPPVGNCSWLLSGDPGIPGFQTTYTAGLLAEFGLDWVDRVPPGALITSLDVEEDAGAFAASVLQTTQVGTFTPRLGTVALAELAATASAEGAQGRVLTAITFRSGVVTYVSYGWSEAPAARYETQVQATTVAGAGSAAIDLAAQGYVITALGAGNLGTQGVVLVGTRREGDTAARDVQVQAVGGSFSSPPGYAPVGYVLDLAVPAWSMIFQR